MINKKSGTVYHWKFSMQWILKHYGAPCTSYSVPGFPNFGSFTSPLMILRNLNFRIIRWIYHSCFTIMTRPNPTVYQISAQLPDASNKSTIITQLLQIRTKFLLAATTLAFILTNDYCIIYKTSAFDVNIYVFTQIYLQTSKITRFWRLWRL